MLFSTCFTVSLQVPQRLYTLDELKLNGIDTSSFLSPVDVTLGSIERNLQFAAILGGRAFSATTIIYIIGDLVFMVPRFSKHVFISLPNSGCLSLDLAVTSLSLFQIVVACHLRMDNDTVFCYCIFRTFSTGMHHVTNLLLSRGRVLAAI